MPRNKRTAAIFLCILSAVIICAACSAKDSSDLPCGIYRPEKAENTFSAALTINEDKTFLFVLSPLSSYLPIGTYEITDSSLILTADDNIYVFKIKNSSLVFDAENSSPIPQYDKFDSVKNGDLFVLEKK